MVGPQPVVDAVKKNICGKVVRELVPGTDKCNGTGKFVHLWKRKGTTWVATRIISYDHQPL